MSFERWRAGNERHDDIKMEFAATTVEVDGDVVNARPPLTDATVPATVLPFTDVTANFSGVTPVTFSEK